MEEDEKSIRKAYPKADIMLATDNDHKIAPKPNAALEKEARAAAKQRTRQAASQGMGL